MQICKIKEDYYIKKIVNNQTEKLDYELRFILAITRNLPRLRGMIRVGRVFRDLYLRKAQNDITVDVFGFKMRLAPHESFSNSACLFFPQLYDYREIRFLRKNLKPGDIFIDIGTHIGFYSLVASQLVGETGKVLAVEADPYVYQKLLTNIQLNNFKNITPLNYGVSDKKEELEFGIDIKQRGKSSFLNRGDEKAHLQCFSLNDIIERAGLNGRKIKGIKVDVEGFEYKILKPFLDKAPDQTHLPDLVLVEYNENVYRDKLDKSLLDAGYILYKQNGKNRIYISKNQNYK